MPLLSIRDYFVRMFDYEDWANQRMLAYLASGRAPVTAPGIFNHLIADNMPWICLLTGRPVPTDVDFFPGWSIDECRRFLFLTMEELKTYVAGLAESEFGDVIESTTLNGRRFENTVSEILTQILSHGQHHRGQIEWIAEQETGEYLGTSYMPYVRQLTASRPTS